MRRNLLLACDLFPRLPEGELGSIPKWVPDCEAGSDDNVLKTRGGSILCILDSFPAGPVEATKEIVGVYDRALWIAIFGILSVGAASPGQTEKLFVDSDRADLIRAEPELSALTF
jgi:hypothetical protein